METKQVVEKLIEFRNIHQAAIDTASKLIEDMIPWTPKEFSWKDSRDAGESASEGILVKAGERAVLLFGCLHTIPGTEVLDIPETAQKRFGVENTFRLKHLLVDEEIASNFAIENLFIGNLAAWTIGSRVPATKFTKPIDLKQQPAQPGLTMSLSVVNTSDQPQLFRAKLVGEELILPWQTKSVA